MKSKQVIVIGAGIAGLVAAYQLKKQGITPVVLEASNRVGGRMISSSSKGYLMDEGAQFLSSEYSILSKLIEEMELMQDYVETSCLVGVVRRGKVKKFRYDRPFSLLTGGLLNTKEWMSFILGSLKLWKNTRKLPLNNYSAWIEYDNESTEEWSNQYFGKSLTEYFIEPLLEAFFFQRPDETSKALAMAINAFGAHKAKTMTLKGGVGKLPELIAKNLDVRLNTSVNDISLTGNQLLINTSTENFKADNVILATPAPISKKIHTFSNTLENELLSTSYSSTINVTIALEDKLSPRVNLSEVYGVWIPRKERNVISAFTIETAKHGDRAKSGELLHVMLSGEAGDIMIKQKKEEIIKMILSELEQYIPSVTKSVAFTKVFRWKYAEPKSQIGRCKRIDNYRKSISQDDKVILAGDYLGMPFTEGAAETGLWAAQNIKA